MVKVLSVNGKIPLVDGKAISATGGGGSTVELDTTLTQSGKAADAKAVGDALAGKQDTISDLETIRIGAAKGATALQSVPSTYRTASEQDTIDSGKVDKVTGKGLSTNDYTDAAKAKVDALAPVATSGNYNDLTNKPTIPAPVTEQTVSGWGFTKNTGTYSKPTNGIPKTDLASSVQASLDKADSALQSHQSLAAYRTSVAQDIIDNGKQDKLIAGENITIAADGKTISATGGGSGYFVINGTFNQSGSITLDKTFAQTLEAIDAGKIPIIKIFGNYFQIVSGNEEFIMFGAMYGDKGGSGLNAIYTYPDQAPQIRQFSLLNINYNGTIPQSSMESAPTSDMEIATKKYVDDGLAGKAPAGDYVTNSTGLILKSSTLGSTKTFKITVDDTGTLSATEVTA